MGRPGRAESLLFRWRPGEDSAPATEVLPQTLPEGILVKEMKTESFSSKIPGRHTCWLPSPSLFLLPPQESKVRSGDSESKWVFSLPLYLSPQAGSEQGEQSGDRQDKAYKAGSRIRHKCATPRKDSRMWGCDPDPIRHPAEGIREKKPRKPRGAFCGISRFSSHPQSEIWRARNSKRKNCWRCHENR